MRKVFESHQQEKVQHYCSILESHEIRAFVKNEASSSIDGVLPGDFILPELWVVDDADYDKAIEILTPYYEGTAGED